MEGEKKLPDKIQSQIQAKFQRVTGGLSNMTSGFSRVVSLKKQKKEVPRLSAKELAVTALSIATNVNRLRDFCATEHRKHVQLHEQHHLYLYGEWLRIERDLLRERAIWGSELENTLNKWKLDLTEGPNRQRKRLLSNTANFYRHYPYNINLEESKPNRKYKKPYSADSKLYHLQFRVESLINYSSSLSKASEEAANEARPAKGQCNEPSNEVSDAKQRVDSVNCDDDSTSKSSPMRYIASKYYS